MQATTGKEKTVHPLHISDHKTKPECDGSHVSVGGIKEKAGTPDVISTIHDKEILHKTEVYFLPSVKKHIHFFSLLCFFPLGHCSCSLKCKFSGSRNIPHFHAVRTTWEDFSFRTTQKFPNQCRNISMQGVENYSYCR